MNRGLFSVLVLLFCVLLVVGMGSCEHESHRRPVPQPRKIILVECVSSTGSDNDIYRVKTMPDDGLSHLAKVSKYFKCGDVLTVEQTEVFK